jgi:FixJ family two-component response regulator
MTPEPAQLDRARQRGAELARRREMDGSGIELRHRLAANGNSVPIIYMTGNDSPAVRTSALQSGCLAYLTKPFSAKSLIEPLKRASAA